MPNAFWAPKRKGALGTLLGAAGAGPRNPDEGVFQFGVLKQPLDPLNLRIDRI